MLHILRDIVMVDTIRAIDRENGMEAMLYPYPYPSIVYREKGLYIVAVYGGWKSAEGVV